MSQSVFIKNIFFRILLTLPLRLRGIILIPLLTKLYPQAIYGAWFQILLISEFLSQILSLRIGTAIIRYVSNEKQPKLILKSAFTITLLCSLLFIPIVIFLGDQLSYLIFGNNAFKSLLLISSIWIAIKALMLIGLSFIRSERKITKLSTRELISAGWLILSVIIAYKYDLNIEYLILLCLIGDFFILIWILHEIKIKIPFTSPSICFHKLKKYLIYSAPLLINSIFLWLTRSLDRLLLVNILDLSYLSIYAVTNQLASLILVILKPINFVLFPTSTHAWNNKNPEEAVEYFNRSMDLIIICCIPFSMIIFLSSDLIITLLAGEDYLSSPYLVLFLLLSCVASAVYQNHIYAIHLLEQTKLLPLLFIGTALLNLILGYILINSHGILGAAIARTITQAAMAFIVTKWARKYLNLKVNIKLLVRILLTSAGMGLPFFFIPGDSWPFLILKIFLGSVIFIGLLFVLKVFYSSELKNLKNQLLHKSLS
jgi:O-antigen/teichoic acid export membrane protein